MIKVENLVKEFDSFRAVDSISFKIRKGEIFGLLGPNGAGKTTTIRMIVGVIKPTNGSVYVGEYDLQKNQLEAKQLLGISPETANAYADLSAIGNLLFMGELYGMKKQERIKKAEELLMLFGLYEKRNWKVKKFSKGMKKRVIVAMALMNNPKVLILDEPTSGLDVESTRKIKELIRKVNSNGTTVFLTTHNIEEANQLCDRVAIMNHGKIVVIDTPERLKHIIQSSVSVEVAFSKKAGVEELKFREVNKVEKKGSRFRLYTNKPQKVIPQIVDYSRSSKNSIVSLNTLGPSLEDVFIMLTECGE